MNATTARLQRWRPPCRLPRHGDHSEQGDIVHAISAGCVFSFFSCTAISAREACVTLKLLSLHEEASTQEGAAVPKSTAASPYIQRHCDAAAAPLGRCRRVQKLARAATTHRSGRRPGEQLSRDAGAPWCRAPERTQPRHGRWTGGALPKATAAAFPYSHRHIPLHPPPPLHSMVAAAASSKSHVRPRATTHRSGHRLGKQLRREATTPLRTRPRHDRWAGGAPARQCSR